MRAVRSISPTRKTVAERYHVIIGSSKQEVKVI